MCNGGALIVCVKVVLSLCVFYGGDLIVCVMVVLSLCV